MMNRLLLLWIAAMTAAAPLLASADGKVAVFPFDAVNVEQSTGAAIMVSLNNAIASHGIRVVQVSRQNQGQNATASPTTQDAAASTAADSETATPGESAGTEEVTSAPAEPTASRTPTDAEIAGQNGCLLFLTGSIVKLGEQITLALELHTVDGAILSAKKVVSRDDAELPKAVDTIALHIATDIDAAGAPDEGKPDTVVGGTAPMTPAPAAPAKSDLSFERNLGISIGQAFSLRDEMYSFTIFNFNGRFEFNQLLLIANAGFGMGNKRIEDGLHFNLDLSLAAYLLKGQVTPYIGGGIGLFMGNRLNDCSDFDDGEYDQIVLDDGSCDDDEDLVGWQVFPVLGVEMLKTFPLRLHVEVRYLVAFNADRNWGHGPMLVLGVAF